MKPKKFNRIKVELAEARRRNSELAAFMGVHASTVSDWCTNSNQPSIQDLNRIAEFLRIDVRLLLVPTPYWAEQQPLSMAAEPEHPYYTKSPKRKKSARTKKK